jgi:hypothetical protein
MALNLVLYIQSNRNVSQTMTKVDLYKDEQISLTRTIQDIRDIEKVRTDFSQPFTLPASAVNNGVFGSWYNPDINQFDSNYRAPALLELNYLPFKKGFITLNKVKMKNNEPEFYNVTFLGETVDLKNVISEDQLEQLSWLASPEFQFINNNNNAKNGLNNGITLDDPQGNTWDNAFIYPLIGHSVDFYYKSNIAQTSPWTNLWTSQSHTQDGVFYNDLKPAIRVDLILKAIEQQYNLTFSNDFFYTSATENLYLWMSRNKGQMTGGGTLEMRSQTGVQCTGCGSFSDCNYFSGNELAGPDFCNDTFLYSNQEVVVFGFEVNVRFGVNTNIAPTNKRQVRIQWQITPDASSANTAYQVIIHNSYDNTQEFNQSGYTGANSWTLIKGNQGGAPYNPTGNNIVANVFFADYYLEVRADSQFTFGFQMQVDYTGPFYQITGGFDPCDNLQGPFQDSRCATYIPATPNVNTEVSVIPTQQMPEMKVLDFLTGLFKTFNLTAYFEDGVTIVKTLDDYYATYNTYDLTERTHSEQHEVAQALPFSDLVLKFQEPVAKLGQRFEQLNNRQYGELRYLADASKKGKYNVENPFSTMIQERLINTTTGNSTTIQVGTMVDDNNNAGFGKPLLFYGIYNDTAGNININWINGLRPDPVTDQPQVGTRTPFNKYWMAGVSNELASVNTPPTINLTYGSEVNTFWLTDYGGNNNSLFQNYYQNYIVNAFDSRNRLYSFKVKLSIDQLLNLKLNDRIIISNRQYKINKIKINMTTGESDLELLNEF